MTRPFRELTTLGVGGPPTELLEAETELDLVKAGLAAFADLDWVVVGAGSNLLVGDDGFDGTVVRPRTTGVRRLETDDPAVVHLRVAAGESWDALVATADYNGWSGIEALSGIPGTVGAAPVQNIGAYGQELSQVLVAVDFLEEASGHRIRVPAAELELGYRSSVLKRGRRGIVIAVELELRAEPDRVPRSRPVAYAQLAAELGVAPGERAPLREVRQAVLRLRAAKGMLLDERDPDSASAGSFFTNPIVTETFARALPAELPRWQVEADVPARIVPLEDAEVGLRVRPPTSTPQRLVKLSAAWLIEHAGIRRGFSLPGSRAAISSKHSLAIVNRGGASAEEIVQLAEFIRIRVTSEFGVNLVPEPVFLGIEL